MVETDFDRELRRFYTYINKDITNQFFFVGQSKQNIKNYFEISTKVLNWAERGKNILKDSPCKYNLCADDITALLALFTVKDYISLDSALFSMIGKAYKAGLYRGSQLEAEKCEKAGTAHK